MFFLLRVDGFAVGGIEIDAVGGAGAGGVEESVVVYSGGVEEVGDVLFVQLEDCGGDVDAVARAYAAGLVDGDD